MEGIPVTLIVKAPNQQIEDQTIQCELTWTISRLKGYLSEVYPSKPTAEEQKIIYSGQLLNDSIILKDVLRRYDGENTNIHTMHLVCLPKRHKSTADIPKTQDSRLPTFEGMRHRNTGSSQTANAGNSEQTTQERVGDPSAEQANVNESPNWSDWNTNWLRYTSQNPQAFYNNRMGPFPDAFHMGFNWNLDPRFQMHFPPPPPANVPIALQNQYEWMQYMYAQQLQTYNTMLARGMHPQMQYPYQYTQFPYQQPNQYEAPPEAVPAEAPIAEEEAAEGGQQRDWLDSFYLLLRWAVLFLIVYFYSSPVRFALVLSLGIIVYIYHIGFFRPIPARIMMPHEIRERQEQAQNGEAQNANAQAANENAPPGQEANPQMQRDDGNNEDLGNQNSLLTLTWTIFTSFFTSLIPEAPNAL